MDRDIAKNLAALSVRRASEKNAQIKARYEYEQKMKEYQKLQAEREAQEAEWARIEAFDLEGAKAERDAAIAERDAINDLYKTPLNYINGTINADTEAGYKSVLERIEKLNKDIETAELYQGRKKYYNVGDDFLPVEYDISTIEGMPSPREIADELGLTDEEQKAYYRELLHTGDLPTDPRGAYARIRSEMSQAKELEEFAKDNKVAASAISVPLSLAGGVAQVGYSAHNLFTGENLKNPLAEEATMLRSAVSEDMGKGGKFVYNTAMSAVDSLVASKIPKGFALLGLSAASQTSNDIIDRGGTNTDALLGGIAAGVFEAFFEKFSIEGLNEIDEWMNEEGVKTLWELTQRALVSIGTNASEEMATEFANIIYDSIMLGDISNARILYDQLIAQGISPDNAKREVVRALAAQVGESALSGALMGGAFAGLGIGAGYTRGAINQVSDYRYSGKVLQSTEEGKQAIAKQLEYAKTETSDTKLQRLAEKYEKKPTAYRAGKLNEKVALDIYKRTTNNGVANTVAEVNNASEGANINATEATITKSNMPEITKINGLDGDKISVQTADGKETTLNSEVFDDVETFDAYLYASTTGSVKTANSFLKAYRLYGGNMSAQSFWSGWLGVETRGQTDTRADALDKAKADFKKFGLTDEAMEMAFLSGRAMRESTANRRQEAQKKYTDAWRESGAQERKGTFNDEALKGKKLDKAQNEYVAFMKAFSETFGVNVELFYSEKGNRGLENGSYSKKKNLLRIDINAGIDNNENFTATKSAIMNTLSHESVHNMAEVANEHYQALKDFVLDRLREDGYNIEDAIEAEIEAYREQGKKIGRETAIEEIVARACEDMLGSSKAVQEFMSEFYAKDKNAANSFVKSIKDFLTKLSNFFKKIQTQKSTTDEAIRIAKQGETAVKQLQKLFDEGILAMREGNMARTDAEVKAKKFTQANDEVSSRRQAEFEKAHKEKQLEIILKYHPRPEWSRETWILDLDDIKMFEETLEDESNFAITPDFNEADMEKAIKSGKVKVYSIHDIRKGTFVTPSYMEAKNYAGSGRVNSMVVALTDVAWIDSLQGQYAPVDAEDDTLSSRRKESEQTDIYSRIFDLQTELGKVRREISEFESSKDFKDQNKKLGEAINNNDIVNGVKAYQEWKEASGYDALLNKKDELQVELESLKKKAADEQENSAAEKEKANIEKSGLSKAEYFRKLSIKEFGYTPYFYDAGYLLPNGKLLNFSGEKGQHFGSRGQDHRAIGVIYETLSGSKAMIAFMSEGNIRVMAETPGLDISSVVEPTSDQYSTIRKFVREYAKEGYIAVDITDESGRVVGTYSYENNINAERVVNDIKYYYSTGKIREQSVVGMFRQRNEEDELTSRRAESDKNRITIGMSDTERSKILHEKSIVAAIYEGQADETISVNKKDLESQQKGFVKAALIRVGDEFNVFTDYEIKDVEVKITLSRKNLKESISKDASPVQLAKLLPILKDAVGNAIGIESHSNRYYYDNSTVLFENLLGGYVDGEHLIPVRFGLKHSRAGTTTLYVIVDQEQIEKKKIKAEIVKMPRSPQVKADISPSTYVYSISQIIPFVNSKDLLRYLPDDMLNAEQKRIKWEGIAETIKTTDDKNDRKYKEFVESGNLRAAQDMVDAKANREGFTEKGYHGTPNGGFTVFGGQKTRNGAPPAGSYWFSVSEKHSRNEYAHYVEWGKQAENPMVYSVWLMLGRNVDIGNGRVEALNYEIDGRGAASADLRRVAKAITRSKLYYTSELEYEAKYRSNLNALVQIARNNYADFVWQVTETQEFADLCKSNNIDSVTAYEEGARDENGNRPMIKTYGVFLPSQIKSADAVTYDDNGNVIPLSERFNSEKDDIRYSLRRQTPPASEILSEYFESDPKYERYKGKAEELKKYQKLMEKRGSTQLALDTVNEDIARLKRERRQSGKGTRMYELEQKARKYESEINELSNRMLEIETSKLASVVESERTDSAIKAQRAERKRYAEKSRERTVNAVKRGYIESIQKRSLDLRQTLLANSNEKHVPEELKEPLSDLLLAIDFSSKRSLKGGEMTKQEQRLSELMLKVEDVLNSQQSEESDSLANYLPDDFGAAWKNLRDTVYNISKQYEGGVVLNEMTAEELKQFNRALIILKSTINQANELFTVALYKRASDLAEASMVAFDAYKRHHDPTGKKNGVKDFLEYSNTTPWYFFNRLGKEGMAIFESLMDAQDQLTKDTKRIVKFAEDTFSEKEAKEWGTDIHYFNIQGEDVFLTTAQIMSLYELDKREQAKRHLLQGGAEAGEIENAKWKNVKNAPERDEKSQVVENSYQGFRLNQSDIDRILSTLTERQMKVADELAKFMQDVAGREWADSIHLRRFGIRLTSDGWYYPIEVSKNARSKTDEDSQKSKQKTSDIRRILNVSALQSVTDKASERIMLNDIFEVFADHVSDMAMYHSLALPLIDTLKWYNFGYKENETRITLKSKLKEAYGQGALKYLTNLITDINNAQETGRGGEFSKKAISRYKVAQVGANLRTVMLQPMSLERALNVLGFADITTALGKGINPATVKEAMGKAEKYCPMVEWKAMGYHTLDVARPLRDKIIRRNSTYDKLVDYSMKGAEKADSITLGYIWMACERKISNTTELQKGTEAYNEAVAKLMRTVIYRTQVVDSVLTRSDLLRSKEGLMQMLGSFASEPTMAYNTMQSAVLELVDKNRRGLKVTKGMAVRTVGKPVAIFAMGAILQAVAESLPDALRDDEDEEFLKKYLDHFVENTISEINPLNLVPIAREFSVLTDLLINIIFGADLGIYNSSRMDTAFIESTTKAIQKISRLIENLAEGDGDVDDVLESLYLTLKAASQAVGLPISNIYREFVVLWNTVVGLIDEDLKIEL